MDLDHIIVRFPGNSIWILSFTFALSSMEYFDFDQAAFTEHDQHVDLSGVQLQCDALTSPKGNVDDADFLLRLGDDFVSYSQPFDPTQDALMDDIACFDDFVCLLALYEYSNFARSLEREPADAPNTPFKNYRVHSKSTPRLLGAGGFTGSCYHVIKNNEFIANKRFARISASSPTTIHRQ